MYIGIGGLYRDEDVITEIIEDVIPQRNIEEYVDVPKGFTYHLDISRSELNELRDMLDDAERSGEILAYAYYDKDWR